MKLTQNREPENGNFIEYVDELVSNSPTAQLLRQRLKNGDLSQVFSGSESSLAKVRKQQQQQLKILHNENLSEARKIKAEARNLDDFSGSHQAMQDHAMKDEVLSNRGNAANRIKDEVQTLQSFSRSNLSMQEQRKRQIRAQKMQAAQRQYEQSQATENAQQQNNLGAAQRAERNLKKAQSAFFVPFLVFGVFLALVSILGGVPLADLLPFLFFALVAPIIIFITSKRRNR